jgi:phosphoglycerate dehydrogenase-like enzyme
LAQREAFAVDDPGAEAASHRPFAVSARHISITVSAGKALGQASKGHLTICFAHVAYRLRERFLALAIGIESFEVGDSAVLEQRIGEADVLVISGLWRNDLLPRAKRLSFIQSIGAGTDQFSREALKQQGVRLASARGVNARAVAEHVMAVMLALARQLPEARDNQAKRVWRGMIGDLTRREDELGGKTLLIVGLGEIGGRLAQLAKAFDIRVIGIRRDPRAGAGRADAVHAMSDLHTLLPRADFVALTCPLTSETEKLIDADSLGRMKPSPYLLNAARGRVVDEPALVDALARRQIRGAALDVMVEEPLPRPRRCGRWRTCSLRHIPRARPAAMRTMCSRSCRRNLARLWRGETELLKQVV